jgi:hypothetical protein
MLEENTEALLDASKDVGVEVNPEKTKYMLMSCCKKTGQKHSINIVKVWQSSNIWEQH